MRAKFIYEKFTEEGDPIRDMKIGSILSARPGDILKLKNEVNKLYMIWIGFAKGYNDIDQINRYCLSEIDKPNRPILFHRCTFIVKRVEKRKEKMIFNVKVFMPHSLDPYFDDLTIIDTPDKFIKYFEIIR